MLRLEDRAELRTALEDYCTTVWIPWAEAEKPRRRSIAVYQRLFEIAQRLLQSGGQELSGALFGDFGLARWTRLEEAIDLPLLERQVEIEIADQKGAAITIRPRAIGAQIDLRAFEKLALIALHRQKMPLSAACVRSRRRRARAYSVPCRGLRTRS